MATSTQKLGVQIRPFILDVSRHLDIADGVLGVAFMPERLKHVYFAEFVGPSFTELAANAELAEHQFYELDNSNLLSYELKRADSGPINLNRATVLDADMEPLIREPIATLFGGPEGVPSTIALFVEPLKEHCSYLYYIPRNGKSNEAWATLCHASFLVAHLLWSTLATAMAAGEVSRTVTRPILVCLPRHFAGYEDRIHRMLEDIERIRSVSAAVSAHLDIEFRSTRGQAAAGTSQPRPFALSIRLTKEGSIPIEVILLERQSYRDQHPLDLSLFGNPPGQRKLKQAIAFLLLRKAMLTGDDADRTNWRELLPLFDAERAAWALPQIDYWDENEGEMVLAKDAPEGKSVWAKHGDGNRRTMLQVKKDTRDFVRKRVSDADKLLRSKLGLPGREAFWFVGQRDGSYQLLVPTTLSPELQRAVKNAASSDQPDVWLRSLLLFLHGETEYDPLNGA